MRKLILSIFSAGCLTAASAQSAETDSKAFFRSPEYNFGNIQQHKPVTHDFWLINHSDQPIQIQNVMASCGCTTPVYSKEAVAAGDSTKVTVGFNAAAAGYFNRSINILLESGQLEQIHVTGVVYEIPVTPAPKNTVLERIKTQK